MTLKKNKQTKKTLFLVKEVKEETTVCIEIVQEVMVTPAPPWEKEISNLLAQGSWENSLEGNYLCSKFM